jgi:hemerythrin
MAIIKDIEKARSLSPKWREELTTGNISIDRQHRNLLGRIDDLVKACIDGRPKDEVIQLMNFLKGYIQTHFAEEEAFQVMHNSPTAIMHKAQHDTLIVRLSDLERKLECEGVTMPVVTESLRLTYEWLLEHIYVSDLAMAKNAKAKPSSLVLATAVKG